MEGNLKYGIWIWIKAVATLFLILSIIAYLPSNYSNKNTITTYIIIFLLLVLNDFIRYTYTLKNSSVFISTILFSMVLTAIIGNNISDYFVYNFLRLYYLLLLFDIVVLLSEIDINKKNFIFFIHAGAYFIDVVSHVYIQKS